ncbi:MAG: ASKHA domain-containing protein [Desulfohalobiaceae bacterium]|nr:ASKHA domain-containing protein [Desulfohalobiaceae bacterium]
MPKLSVEPLDVEIEFEKGETIRDVLQREGIDIESPCNGEGTCGKCRVWVKSVQDLPETEHESITPEQAAKGLRLACLSIPEHDLRIELPADFSLDAKRFRQAQQILEGERLSWSRVLPAAAVHWDKGMYWFSYQGLDKITAIKQWKEGFVPKGLSVDLGTTSLVVSLLSLKSGEELATTSSLNPQIKFGHDIMTRIHHGSSDEGLKDLSESVRHGLNSLIEQACLDSNSDPLEILDVVVGGNTTMLQLAAGLDPAPLGKLPFTVGIQGATSYPVSRFGLQTNPLARVYVPPITHAFVGTDISAGLLMSQGFFDDQLALLFMDIGTNGEMGLNLRGKRLMTSTAAGPAFEGAGLSSGMRASTGAIETVTTDGRDICLETIGRAPIKGICGSGLMDLIAVLLGLGVIDHSGRMLHPDKKGQVPEPIRERIEFLEDQPAFRLEEGVYLTQRDVRQVQLAKAAVRAAMEEILHEAGSDSTDLDRIVIAGGFGFSLNPGSLEAIGLLPEGTREKVHFAGNTSRSGCAWLLIDTSYRLYLEEKMKEVEHVSIAERKDFMEVFVQRMHFPEPCFGESVNR